MRAVIQRVTACTLSVDGETVSEIGAGLTVYLGIKRGDTKTQAEYVAKKTASMRIFEDTDGKMNLSVSDVGGEIMLVSQFTLLADARRGNRPSFSDAELPELARPLYEYTADELRKYGITVKTGVFGADMKIEQNNDGPVTIILDTDD